MLGKVCIIGDGLSSLILAKVLFDLNIKVDVIRRKPINKKSSTQEKAKKNDNKQKSARPSAQRKVRSSYREDIKSDPKGKVTARSSNQRKERSLDREDIKSDSKEKVIPTDKVAFEKKGVHPKKNSILNDEKNNEPDKKAIKSAKEWGQATNDPRKKTT